jgi:chromosome segregation ATPase
MTRKEPKFDDDLTTSVSVALPKEPVRDQPKRTSHRPANYDNASKSGYHWLLWLFVLASLCVSFGTAFFGLEEAGRYQAALTKAETQAKELEATIRRLNKVQTQGIGELAQSDAQMRKMVQSMESRLQSDITSDLSALAKQLDTLKQQAAETSANVKKQAQTIERLFDASETKSKTLKANLNESVALLSEQINIERTRVDAVTDTRQATIALNEEVRAVKQVLTDLEAQLMQVETDRAASVLNVKDIELVVEGINEQLAQLASTNNALLGLEVLSEEMDRLSQQVSQQQQIIEAVDASRKQLTQRIIDLDGRVNLALSSKE